MGQPRPNGPRPRAGEHAGMRANPAVAGLADGVGFEPTNGFPLLVFKTSAFNHSATHPMLHIVLQRAARVLVLPAAAPLFPPACGLRVKTSAFNHSATHPMLHI